MPMRGPRACSTPGCARPAVFRGACETHRRQDVQDRGSATERGYGYAWTKARAHYLRHHPLCVRCEALGYLTAATVVDHVTPHRGDMVLFWRPDNWQALCKRCHDVKTGGGR